jgi:hypothetical protein
MPNTLVHFGVQGGLSRAAWRRLDPRWIYLACLLPDLPWIVWRVATTLAAGFLHPLDVRLYATAQASLACTALLCGAIAALTRRPGTIFAVLSLGAVAHLLLDACEIKWGNGVHLLAPWSWKLTSFAWFWPDDPLVAALSVLGLVLVAWELGRDPLPLVGLTRKPARIAAALVLLAAYATVPLGWMGAVEASGSYSLDVMRRPEQRPGQPLSLDRHGYFHAADGNYLQLYPGERVRAVGQTLDRDATVSIRGVFVDATTVRIEALHEHRYLSRDIPSYAALALLVGLWARPLIGSRRRHRPR